MVHLLSIILIAMLSLVAAVARASELVKDEESGVTPVRLHDSFPADLGICYSESARRSGSEGSVKITVTVGSDGSVKQLKVPLGIEPWQEETARCVINLLRFDPATKDGEPVASDIVVPLNLNLAGESGITPPKLLPSSPEKVGKCYSRYARRTGGEGRVVVVATVEPNGRVSQYELPPGIKFWQEETAKCVMDLLTFDPATRDGVPVTANVQFPINFHLIGSDELTYPGLASTEVEVENAYRTCYPMDQRATAEPKYRVTVNPFGKATKITLVESAGDESLDQAGVCVLKMLKFQPARRGREAVQSTAIMPIELRPPK